MNGKLLGLAVLCLLVGAVIGYSLSILQIGALQSHVSSLESTIASMQSEYRALNITYNQLMTEHDPLEIEYRYLLDLFKDLQSKLDYDVYVLNDQQYYHSLKWDLERANTSIEVAMYSMIYDSDDSVDWANDLINEFVYAHNRGISVNVVIENKTYFGYMDDNWEAHDYLLASGVPVQMDNNGATTDHLKLVVIDHQIVYVGSHNWSESALYYNHETSVRIVSEEIAETFEAYLQSIYGT